MRVRTLFVLAFFAATLVASQILTIKVNSQSSPTEAPAGFDNQTNGFTPQPNFDARPRRF